MDESTVQLVEQLEKEYLPLDPALVQAIVSDYDLSKREELQTARELLDTLRASALVEEGGGFDPSGTSGKDAQIEGSKSNGSVVSGTEESSLSNGLSNLSMETAGSSSSGDDHALEQMASLSNDAKAATLVELFPTLKPTDISYHLKKCGFDIGMAMDTLLNLAFFEDSNGRGDGESYATKGVEAFSEDNHARKSRQKKSKAKKFQSLDEHARSSSTPPQTPTNKWNNASSDIQFVASRVHISTAVVSSMYHKNGASKEKTILALVEQDLLRTKPNEDATLESNAVDLLSDFPVLTFEQCIALLRLAKSSTANAHELAKALTAPKAGTSLHGPIVPHYTPVKLEDDSSSSPPSSPRVVGHTGSLLAARATAFDNASRYNRMSKSDRLMGGAAAYYSSIGRDYSAAIKTAAAADADAIAASQSSATHLDLHGVTVKEATRIAAARTQVWWDGLGESRIPGGGRTGAGSGFRIVTGLGRHSEGGVGKLGPAVLKALIRDGWKVEVGSGELLVTGKMRR